MTKKTHILIGTGIDVEVPQSVINESLHDVINEGDTLVLPWYGKPTEALRMVYDYVFDQGIEFMLILHDTGSKVPKVFTDSSHGFVINPNSGLAKAYVKEYLKDDSPGAFLVLGGEDDDTTNTMTMDVYALLDALLEAEGVQPIVSDLGDGLTTVEIVGDADEDEPVEEPATVVATDDDPTDTGDEKSEESDPDPLSFSTEELEHMPVRVLKNLCAQVMDDVPKGTAKQPYIDAIEATRDALRSEIETNLDVEEVEEKLEDALHLLLKVQEVDPSRVTAIVLTKVEEALLWYHYGADIHGGK